MSVIVLDNKRIFLNRISRYELNSDELYHRNDTDAERFLFIFLINEDELWSEYKFKYLYIETYDGNSYKYYSDRKLENLMKEMDEYFHELGIGSEVEDCSYDFSFHGEPLEEILDLDEHLELAIESYVRIRDTYKFINEDISSIVNRIDNAYGTI